VDHLPEEIGQCNQLEYLQLNKNQLKQLPKNLRKCGNLKHFDISFNDINCLPFQKGDLPNLHSFQVAKNKRLNFKQELDKFIHAPITFINGNSIEIESIPEEIYFFKGLEHLYLQDNKINDFVELASFHQLQNLFIKQNPGSKYVERKQILKLFHLFNEMNLEDEKRKIYFALILNYKAYTQKIAVDKLLIALNFPDAIVQNNVYIALDYHIKNPFFI